MSDPQEVRLNSRALSRPVIAGSCVVVFHLLIGIALRHDRPPRYFPADKIAPSPLYILPIVVERFEPLPPIPDPVLRTVPSPKWVTPTVELPTSPLDVMAVTIATDNTPERAKQCAETAVTRFWGAGSTGDLLCNQSRVSQGVSGARDE
jgi:hypothetical protein